MPKAAGAAAERRFAYYKKKRPSDGAFFCGKRLLAPPHPPCIPPSRGKGGLFKNPVPWGNLTLLPCGGNFTTLPRGKGGKTPRTFRKVRGVKQKAVPAKRGFLAPLNTCFKGGAAERRGDGGVTNGDGGLSKARQARIVSLTPFLRPHLYPPFPPGRGDKQKTYFLFLSGSWDRSRKSHSSSRGEVGRIKRLFAGGRVNFSRACEKRRSPAGRRDGAREFLQERG